MTESGSRYDYQFDPEGDSTAARVCRMVGSQRQVLELGCAAGAMSAVMVEHYGCQVTGVEYDAQAASLAARHCEQMVVASLEAPDWMAPLQSRQFDTVVAADVLEHLHQPDACLRQLHELLSEDGRLVVSVPSIAHSGVIAGLLRGNFDYTEVGLLDRTHVHFFTRASLGRMLHANGFKVLEVQTVDTGPWHPEFQESWAQLPGPVHDWLAANPVGRAYQVLMLAQRTATPVRWNDDATVVEAQQAWLQSTPAAAAVAAQPAPAAPSPEEARLQQQCAALQEELEQMRRSHSWRVTAPLRRIARLLK